LRLGILGGAFNPPHLGHLVLAREAHSQLGLDAVVLVPFNEPPHRELESDPGAEARFEMTELAARDQDWLDASRIEIDRPGPSYTVDTLRELSGRGELFLLMGGDEAASLADWRAPDEVRALATVAAVERRGFGRDRMPDGARLIEMPRVPVSSTLVRERAAAGLPIRELVPEAVADYIEERGLYAAPVGAE
jgi:nicotinate-nucleotide adenylyltransferase